MRAIFVPTVKEAEGIFGDIKLQEYKYGIIKGAYRDIPVYVTSVTKTSAAFSASMVLSEGSITEALLTGICGAYVKSGLSVGDVVSVQKDFFADEAVFYEDRIDSIGDLGFKITEGGFVEFATIQDMPIINSNTVSFLDGVGRVSEMMRKKTGASVENMEGAAFGYVCNMLKIKAFQVRGVSNFCGARSEQRWNIRLAFDNLKRFFESVYKK